MKEWIKALDKTRILAPSNYFYHFSFPRYGRLKSKFLCERYSLCIFSSCSNDLTKSRYTWSLTAVPSTLAGWYCKEMMARRSLPIFARSYLYSCSMWEIFIRAQFDAQVNLDTRSLNSQQSQKSCGKKNKRMAITSLASRLLCLVKRFMWGSNFACKQTLLMLVIQGFAEYIYVSVSHVSGFKADMSHCHYSGGRKG